MLFEDIFTGAVFCVKANQLLKGSTSGNPIIGSSLVSPSPLIMYSPACPPPPPKKKLNSCHFRHGRHARQFVAKVNTTNK